VSSKPKRTIVDAVMASKLLAKLCLDHEESAHEHRHGLRRKSAGRVTLVELDVTGRAGKSWEAHVLDSSSGGIGLLSPIRVIAGQVLLLDLARSAGDAPATVMLRVRHCRAAGDSFKIGAAYENRARIDEAA
jgi:hypothetical protein